MVTLHSIHDFFNQKHIAVAGVSRKKGKFGIAIYKELTKKGFALYPVNPHIDEFEGVKCYKNLVELPDYVTGIIISTPDEVTQNLVKEAEKKGIQNIWLQQGCATEETINTLNKHQANIITGHCVLMFAPPVKGIHGFHRWLKKSFGKFPN